MRAVVALALGEPRVTRSLELVDRLGKFVSCPGVFVRPHQGLAKFDVILSVVQVPIGPRAMPNVGPSAPERCVRGVSVFLEFLDQCLCMVDRVARVGLCAGDGAERGAAISASRVRPREVQVVRRVSEGPLGRS